MAYPLSSQSSAEIMNVREMIDFAFGDLNANTVNFKLIQMVLYLLARQLRLLERRVEVSIPLALVESKPSTLKVTEVKIHAAKSSKLDIHGDKSSTSSMKDLTKQGKGKRKDKKKESAIKISESKERQGKDTKDVKLYTREVRKIIEDSISLKEVELRVFHQRADSYEQPEESPSPMASVEEFEKLLIVERVPSGTERASTDVGKTPKISVVTQEEFLRLSDAVAELQKQFGPIGKAEFPENAKLMQELRKCASLTDAMAALQLSARLEATEKALGHIIGIVSTVASSTPGVVIDEETKKILSQVTGVDVKEPERPLFELSIQAQNVVPEQRDDCVTYSELNEQLQKLNDEMMTEISGVINRNTSSAEKAFKVASTLEKKLDLTLDVGPRLSTLESLVYNYVEQINALDTGLSSQMTHYQEQLTQMQHELDVGLETMAENIANTGGDAIAVAELNNSFMGLQTDFESINYRQRDLKETQDVLGADLEKLWKQLEMLQDTKADRDEVTDALRDKAGIDALNGIVSLEQFDAVRGDLEKRIASAYDKFNNQEIVWQKAIDDLLRELSEKGDLVQLYSLHDEINKYLNAMLNRIKTIEDIVGEPKAAATNKKLFRDTCCISCATPATMEIIPPAPLPILPRFGDKYKPKDNDSKPKGDGDNKLCYPGHPIPHPMDPRSHICRRYCGGSHTMISGGGPSKIPPGTIITPINAFSPRTAGKLVKMGDTNENVPCIPCNKVPTEPKGAKLPAVDENQGLNDDSLKVAMSAEHVDNIL